MTGPGDVFLALTIIGLPIAVVGWVLSRFMKLKERQIELEVHAAAEKAAQYAVSNKALEARVQVLEQIVTDGGLETAAQIEALRKPQLSGGDKIQ